MKNFRIDLWGENEYTYAQSYGFMPNIRAFLHDEDDEKRACILVAPGGGYCMCAPHEGELVALEFYKKGLNAFVITYTTDITFSEPLKDQPSRDLARAVRIIRKNADKYNVFTDKLVICGFSAAGHLCATLAVHFQELTDENEEYSDISARPDAVILGYPVITAGDFTHGSSIEALLGRNPSREELEYYSLEKQVTGDTPPCFIWQTLGDSLVPVENSYLFAEALRKNKIEYAQYVFPFGDHGLSIASPEQFAGWHGGEYSFEQLHKVLDALKENRLANVPERRIEELKIQFQKNEEAQNDKNAGDDGKDGSEMREENSEKQGRPQFPPSKLFSDVNMWPELAYIWMARLFKLL